MTDQKRKPRQKLNIRVLALLFVLVAFCTITAGTMAWYNFQKEMRAVSAVRYPNAFFLKGPKGNDSEPLYIPRIDMSNVAKQEEFFFTVIGKGDYKIQIGYTTNVPYQFYLYRLKPPYEEDASGRMVCKYEEETLYFEKKEADNLLVTKLNANGKVAQSGSTLSGGKYATYDAGDQVQKNAEPVYEQTDLVTNFGETEDTGFYVLVIDWSQITGSELETYKASEETDMICIVAGNAGSESNN